MPLSLNDFCFVFSLQAGVVATSTIGFTMMVMTFIFNLYAPNSMDTRMQICQYTTLYIYLIIMMIAFGMAFMSSFWAKSKLIKISAIILIIGTIFYFILSLISYIREGDAMWYICPDMRCPDHHWLQDSRWRSVYIAMERDKKDSKGKSLECSEEGNPSQPIQTVNGTTLLPLGQEVIDWFDQSGNVWEWMDNITESDERETSTEHHRPTKRTREKDVLMLMFVSFIYSTCFLVYFIYTVMTLFAFATQIDNE